MKTHHWLNRNRLIATLRVATAVTLFSAAAAMAFVATGDRFFTVGSPPSKLSQDRPVISKIAGERDAESTSARTTPGEGPIGGYEAYKSATRTYTANVIPPSMVQNAKKTFNKIATQTAANSTSSTTNNNHWLSYGPIQNSVQPGVLSFSGATTPTASRDTALVIAPTCVPGNCRLWVGTAGGGVWRTDDALAATPTWTWLTGVLALNSVVDPTTAKHLFVGSALGVRGLSHTVGVGTTETQRFEPGANPVGVYESTDGGNTFTEVWNGNGSTFGVTDVGLDPLDPTTVYAAAFDQGVWRRSPSLDHTSSPTAFEQVFAPQFAAGAGIDRTMFAATVKKNRQTRQTRIYLTDGTANGGTQPSNFWRTDNAGQTAAALLASQAAGSTVPPDTTVGPQVYNGWQKLTSSTTASP